jgi:hypothetical protein
MFYELAGLRDDGGVHGLGGHARRPGRRDVLAKVGEFSAVSFSEHDKPQIIVGTLFGPTLQQPEPLEVATRLPGNLVRR